MFFQKINLTLDILFGEKTKILNEQQENCFQKDKDFIKI